MPNGDLGQQLFNQFNLVGQQHAAAVNQGTEFLLAIRKLKMAEEAQQAEIEMMKRTQDLKERSWAAEKGMLDQQIKQLTFSNEQNQTSADRQKKVAGDIPEMFRKLKKHSAAVEKGKYDEAGAAWDEFTVFMQGKEHAPELLQTAIASKDLFQTPDALLRATAAGMGADMRGLDAIVGERGKLIDEAVAIGSSRRSVADVDSDWTTKRAEMAQEHKGVVDELAQLKAAGNMQVNFDTGALVGNADAIQGAIQAMLSQSRGLSDVQKQRLLKLQEDFKPMANKFYAARYAYEYEKQNMQLKARIAERMVNGALDGVLTKNGAAMAGTVVLQEAQKWLPKIDLLRGKFEGLKSVQAVRATPTGDEPLRDSRKEAVKAELAATPEFAQLPAAAIVEFLGLLDYQRPILEVDK